MRKTSQELVIANTATHATRYPDTVARTPLETFARAPEEVDFISGRRYSYQTNVLCCGPELNQNGKEVTCFDAISWAVSFP